MRWVACLRPTYHPGLGCCLSACLPAYLSGKYTKAPVLDPTLQLCCSPGARRGAALGLSIQAYSLACLVTKRQPSQLLTQLQCLMCLMPESNFGFLLPSVHNFSQALSLDSEPNVRHQMSQLLNNNTKTYLWALYLARFLNIPI